MSAANSASVQNAMHLALEHHREGRLPEAEQLFRKVLELNPNQPQALHHLGVIALKCGKAQLAAELIERARSVEPSNASILTDLGATCRVLGRLKEAEQLHRRAQALSPDRPEVHNNLGNVLRDMGQLPDAEECFRRALALKPNYVDALNNLGHTLIDLQRLEEAERCFRHSLTLDPGRPETHCRIGIVQQALGQLQEAGQSLRRALALKPDYAEAYHNLGIVLHLMGRLDEAELGFRRALDLAPNSAEARTGLGDLFVTRANVQDAELCYRQALASDPACVGAYNSLGHLLRRLGRLEDAEKCYRKALTLSPDGAELHSNLGSLLIDFGRHEEAEACYRQALELKPDFAGAHSNLIFLMDLMNRYDIREQQAERRRWYAQHGLKYATEIRTHQNSPDPERKLRVGYVSADFRRHSAYYAISPVICGHDHSAFDVYCYSGVLREDDATARLKSAVQHWRSTVGIADSALAEQIRNDRIDVLVDLSGHSAGNRLLVFARKPAPVQITAWGHSTGTGLDTMDYFFADPVLVPQSERAFFAEKILDLPCVFCYEAPDYAPAVNDLPAFNGKPFTFSCINRIEKVSDRALETWGKIMASVPLARLLVKDRKLGDAKLNESFLRRVRAAGIESSRVQLVGGSLHAEHLQTYHEADLALDPYPHGGGISTAEAIWMGVPVVALNGNTPTGRLSASILVALNMQSWVAHSESDYVRIAVEAANDLTQLRNLRRSLRNHAAGSEFGDARRYTAAVERAYRTAWHSWCKQRETARSS
ncbi:MAG: tetratricopeptide repeat protein [Burkholderiales bacterium]